MGDTPETSHRLDRRQFLKLAAATSAAIAGSAALSGSILGQSLPPTAPMAADPIADLAASLGHDLQRLFRFVQDEIRYEPYAGVLRGARGTLVARAGNSADQALLLGALLKAGSVPYRFVTGALDDVAAQALIASTVTDTATAREQIEAIVGGGGSVPVPELAPPGLPVSAEEFERLRLSVAADVDAMVPVAARQLQASVDTIMRAIAAADIELPMSVSQLPPLERSGHVWVQASDGSTWVDLDPSMPSAQMGEAPAAPGDPLEALPDELRHALDFRVIAETLTDGALVQATIFEHREFADDLTGVGISFTHARADDLPDAGIVRAGFGGAVEYNAVLVVGTSSYVAKQSISIGGGGGDPFGGFGGGGGEGIVEGETGAEWLEVGVTSPGAGPVVARRTIFDRIGQTVREGGQIDPYAILPAEIVDLGPGLPGEYLPCRAAYLFSVAGGPLDIKDIVRRVDPNEPAALSLVAHGYHAAREALSAEVSLDSGCRPFADSPNVASWVLHPSPEGYASSFDLWHRSFGTSSLSDRAPTAPPALIAGVLSHVAERVSTGDGLPSRAADARTLVSVGSLFEMAEAQGIGLRVLRDRIPSDLSLTPELASAIASALDGGSIVVVPERGVTIDGTSRLGWWLVDPGTGAATDRLDNGGGATGTEDTLIRGGGSTLGQRLLACLSVTATPFLIALTVALWDDLKDQRLIKFGLVFVAVGLLLGDLALLASLAAQIAACAA